MAAAVVVAGGAHAQEAPAKAAPDPALVAEVKASLNPKVVIGGVPPADARVAEVGACVWASMSAADRRARIGAAPEKRTVPEDHWDYPAPLANDALFDADLIGRVRACDPNLTRHWRYSVLAGAAVVEREAALARLARAGLSEAELLAAWT
ncbi:hypothetical protein, partial [Caulobacter sp. 17J65-9]|uniref:hypothetical protein n=1 Tax=Caulobacter sp. 17J65-9 TaxID=2709382 RepID=UPI0013CCDEF3